MQIICKICTWLAIFFSLSGYTLSDQVTDLPGLTTIKNRQYAGYLSTGSKANLFYWYVESDKPYQNTPLVLWLNGGPGASSLYGFLMENGPMQVNDKGLLQRRVFSWTRLAHYLVIDQPIGVGYSAGSPNDYQDEAQAMEHLYRALLQFYQKHPELKSHPLILAGESYAGKYLPQLAMHILQQKEISLAAIMIGDPWINPLIQQQANIDYAYFHGLIDDKTRRIVAALYQQCVAEINQASPSTSHANQVCERMQQTIREKSGNINLANIGSSDEPSDAPMVHYLNRADVRQALHVPKTAQPFATFSGAVAKKLETGEQDAVSDLYSKLLSQHIPIIIYNGLDDAKDSNFLGIELLIKTFKWPEKTAFTQAETCVWRKEKVVYGYAKTGGGLTQVKIRGAGHLAPIDQPQRVFDLFSHVVTGKSWC